ncbi:MAG: AI-2E family transporter [Lachnospiraceae bacterium]|nr:AI-2E family transporter [Lachnospiraceae bacterium]
MGFLIQLWKKNIVKLIVVTAGVLLFFKYLLPFLAPFFIAFLFVLIFYPLIKKVHKKIKIPEGILAGLLMGFLALLLALVLWFGLCKGMDLLGDFRENSDYLETCCKDALNKCCVWVGDKMNLNPADLQTRILKSTDSLLVSIKETVAPKALNASYSYAGEVFEGVFFVVITAIAIILLIKDYDAIKEKLSGYSSFIKVRELCRKILVLLKVYVRAQLIIVACVTGVAVAGFFACGVEQWLLCGILTGILDMLPFIGSGIVILPVAIFSFLQGKIWKGVACLFIYSICVFLREILEPKLIGDKLNVFPIVVLLSVFFGIRFFSIGGIVLGPVSFFLIREIYEEVKE